MLKTPVRALLSLDASEVAAAAKPVGYEIMCGVYFLVHEGQVVYVGQSTDIASRLIAHRAGRAFKFSSIAWVAVPKPYLNMVESWYFHKFKPIHTKATPIRDVEFLRRQIARSTAACFLDLQPPSICPDPQHLRQLGAAEVNVNDNKH